MRALNHLTLVPLSVKVKATIPNPGQDGAVIWSTYEKRVLVWENGRWENNGRPIIRCDGNSAAETCDGTTDTADAD